VSIQTVEYLIVNF